VPVPTSAVDPATPGTATAIDVGAQPLLSVYRTEKVKVEPAAPDPGLTVPLLSEIECDAPEQAAAITGCGPQMR
jgi:hypothetical protein